MSKPAIKVTVAYGSKGGQCDAACGIDWSSPEATAVISQQTRERFGDSIDLKFVDLSQPGAVQRTPELKRLVKDEDMPLPLLLINGQPRISGQFDIPLLLHAIDTEIEIRQLRGQD